MLLWTLLSPVLDIVTVWLCSPAFCVYLVVLFWLACVETILYGALVLLPVCIPCECLPLVLIAPECACLGISPTVIIKLSYGTYILQCMEISYCAANYHQRYLS